MTCITKLARTLDSLSLSDTIITSHQSSSSSPELIHEDVEKDLAPSYIQYKKLQDQAIIDAACRVIDPQSLGPLPELEEQNTQDLINSTLQFPCCSGTYTLYVGYRELLHELQRYNTSVRIVGSGAAKLCGSRWYQKALHLDQIDLSHIDKDADDIDTHIHASNSSNLELVLVDLLIKRHYEQVQFQVSYKDTDPVLYENFFSFLLHFSNVTNRCKVPSKIQLITQIPWLHNTTIEFHELVRIWTTLDTYRFSNQTHPSLIDLVQLELACSCIFKKTTDELRSFIVREVKPFIHYHALCTSEVRDWHRISCKDIHDTSHDVLFMYKTGPGTRTSRIAFQNLHITSPTTKAEVRADWQAVIDKSFRLMRWVDIDLADHKDWALFQFYVTLGYVCVEDMTANILQNLFLQYCQRASRPFVEVFSSVIEQKVQKRSYYDPTLHFACIFNALSQLPETVITRENVASICKTLPNGAGEQSAWQVLLKPLISETLDFNIIHLLLKRLAYSYFLLTDKEKAQSPLKAAILEHNCQMAIQVDIDGYYFVFPLQIAEDLLAYAEALSCKTGEEHHHIQQIVSAMGFEKCYTLNKNRLLAVADTSSIQNKAVSLIDQNPSEAYQLLLLVFSLYPSENNYLTLLQFLPHQPYYLKFLREHLSAIKGLSVQSEQAILASLLHKPQNLIESLLQAEHEAVNRVGLELCKKSVSFELVHSLAKKRLGTAFKLLSILRQMQLGSFENWHTALIHVKECLRRNDPQFVAHLYSFVEHVRWCQNRWPEKKNQLERDLYKLVIGYFQQSAIETALNAIFIFWKQSDHPVLSAIDTQSGQMLTNISRLYLEAEVPELKMLAKYLLLQFANPETDQALFVLFHASQPLQEAKSLLNECMKHSPKYSYAKVWAHYCAIAAPEETKAAYDIGSELGFWKSLSPKAHAQFFATIISKLIQTQEKASLALAYRLAGQYNDDIQPFLEPRIADEIQKRTRMDHLQKLLMQCTPDDFGAKIDQILSLVDFDNSSECSAVQERFKQVLPQSKTKNRPLVRCEVLQKPAIQRLYQNSPIAYLQLCKACITNSPAPYIDSLTSFITQYPPRQYGQDFNANVASLIPLSKSCSVSQKALLSLLTVFNEASNTLWHQVFSYIAEMNDIDTKRAACAHAEVLLSNHEKVTTIDEYALWIRIQALLFRLLFTIYSQANENDDLKKIQGLYEQMQRPHPLAERFADIKETQLQHFLLQLLQNSNACDVLMPNKLYPLVAKCRFDMQEYNLKPENRQARILIEKLIVTVFCQSDNETQILYAFHSMENLFSLLTVQETTSEYCDLFVTLVQRVNDCKGEKGEIIENLLCQLLLHYERYLVPKKDPITLIAALLNITRGRYLQYTAFIALARQKFHRPKSNSPAYTEYQLCHKRLVERLLNTYDAPCINLAQHLIDIPNVCSSYQLGLVEEYLTCRIVGKFLEEFNEAAATDKLVSFFNKILIPRCPGIGDEVPNSELSSWVQARKNSMKLDSFRAEDVFSACLTGFADHLVQHFTPHASITPAMLEKYFLNTLLPDLKQSSLNIALGEQMLATSVPKLVTRLLQIRIASSNMRQILLICSYMYCSQAISRQILSPASARSLVELFCLQPNNLPDELLGFHEQLSKMLLNEQHVTALFNFYPSERFLLSVATHSKIVDTYCLQPAVQLALLKNFIDKIIEGKYHCLTSKYFSIIQSAQRHGLHFNPVLILDWNVKLLQQMEQRHRYSDSDLVVVGQICGLNIAIFDELKEALPNESKLTVVEAQNTLLNDIVVHTQDSQRKAIISLGIDLLRNLPRLIPNAFEYMTQKLAQWMTHVSNLELSDDDKLFTYSHMTYIMYDLHRYAVASPGYKSIWAHMTFGWNLILIHKNEPYCVVLSNWLSSQLKNLPADLKEFSDLVSTFETPVDSEIEQKVLAELVKLEIF